MSDNLERLKRLIIDILEEKQVENIVTFSPGINNIASCVIIASGRSTKNIHAIAEYLNLQIKTKLQTLVRSEGLGSSEWVLLDTGEILVNLFTPATRAYYNLEELYHNFPRENAEVLYISNP